MTISERIKSENIKYDFDIGAAKVSVLSSSELDKYAYLLRTTYYLRKQTKSLKLLEIYM